MRVETKYLGLYSNPLYASIIGNNRARKTVQEKGPKNYRNSLMRLDIKKTN